MKGASKNKRMPLKVTCTRYSLVKGERIVRFVLNTRLREDNNSMHFIFILRCGKQFSMVSQEAKG
ncbi:hypothetical protein Lal_00013287 [Lupinus albus]|nr:hypothetical protein Lal_00013287 [Lupinus albus]